MRKVVACGLTAFLAAACGSDQAAPSSASPSTVSPAPKAALSVGRGDVNPPLGVADFTQLVFDGTRSSGDGLTYLLEFGDGTSSTQPVATHRGNRSLTSALTARLTVTDRHGRSDSATQPYFLASVANVSGTFWFHNLSVGPRTIQRTLFLTQDGATLSGWYKGPEAGNQRVSGTLNDDRAIHLRTEDGSIEFRGAVDWKPDNTNLSQARVLLRLSVRGGTAGGTVLDFAFAEPY